MRRADALYSGQIFSVLFFAREFAHILLFVATSHADSRQTAEDDGGSILDVTSMYRIKVDGKTSGTRFFKGCMEGANSSENKVKHKPGEPIFGILYGVHGTHCMGHYSDAPMDAKGKYF